MARWVDRPVHYPGKCALTGYSEALHGPYWEGPLVTHRTDGSGLLARDLRGPVYVSTAGMREVLSAPGSPFVPMNADLHRSHLAQREADIERAERAELALADAEARIAELEAELLGDGPLGPVPASAEDIAAAVAERLGDTFARKAGRKAGVPA